eukprot:TRINITY_DN34651_c0_g1_i1.p1 TRINITY_DN34651_c0_g1~~TRINITY_DN34651_c0_g1_i1.p1  ORF type:complete len:831 (-),score=93.50 TRINITY_DN34651_c0_g1_i1:123-2615(-)
MLFKNPLCFCPASIEPLRHHFNGVLQAKNVNTFRDGMMGFCDQHSGTMMKMTDTSLMLDASLGSVAQSIETASAYRRAGGCLPAVTAITYSCMMSTWLSYDNAAFVRVMNILLPLLMYTVGCFEPKEQMRWQITTGWMLTQLASLLLDGSGAFQWKPIPMSFCTADRRFAPFTALGYCSDSTLHSPVRAVAGPLEVIDDNDVVLCTHTSVDSLEFVERMLESWQGPASVAVCGNDINVKNALKEGGLNTWLRRLGEQGFRKVVISRVLGPPNPSTTFDKLYPANVLRQVALDASPGKFALIADPGFVPSPGFFAGLKPSSPLGEGVRSVLHASSPSAAAFLVASFVIFDAGEVILPESAKPGAGRTHVLPEGDEKFGTNAVTLSELRRLLETGGAASFDTQVCPLCRAHAWQWLLVTEPQALRFKEVEWNDLNHPAWLVRKEAFPRFPPYMHGLVGPRSGMQRIGWSGLPRGLRTSAEQIAARGGRILLLPGHFLQRSSSLPLPVGLHSLPRPLDFLYELAFRHFLQNLRSKANATVPVVNSRPQTLLSMTGRLVEVVPPRTGGFFTLKHGTDSSLQIIVMASIIIGSDELQTLTESVPWTVHAVAVGVRDYWRESMRELPDILRSFGGDTIVAIVDAYDMIFLPCGRSVVDEYRKLARPIVMTAEKTCFPNATLCRTCEERYPAKSDDLKACKMFPNVNGGGIMGAAWALVEAFEWMYQQGSAIGRDDQENKWHMYNYFFDRGMAVLDHRQRIWANFFACKRDAFWVEGCGIISNYTGKVCFAHGNGGTKWEILQPLLRTLREKGCLKTVPRSKGRLYSGLGAPTMIWS